MKPKHFIAPLVALALAGIWLGVQRGKIVTTRAENATMRDQISEARNAEVPKEGLQARSHGNNPDIAAGEPIDWEGLVRELAETERAGGVNGRKMISLQRRLFSMDAAELAAALDHIATLEMAADSRMKLRGMLVGPLAEKDPELALNRFKGDIVGATYGLSFQLQVALGNWAEKDMASATAWFDSEVAAGTFDAKSLDGKNTQIEQFESQLIAKMLSSGAADAEARLSAMTSDMRKEVLRGHALRNLGQGEQAAYAGLVRSQFDKDSGIAILGGLAADLARGGGFAKVDAYLDRISATEEEREQCAREAALGFLETKAFSGKLTTGDIDTMRNWAAKGVHGAVDKLTGEGIADAINGPRGLGFDEGSKLVLGYRDSTGNDDVLIGFLEKAESGKNMEQARKLAAKVNDPNKRAELMERFQ